MKKLFKLILNTIPRPILIRLSIVARPIIAFLLKGNKFTDPIDGNSFKMFLPYGYGNQRNNVLSPSTLSLERHRLLWLYLINEKKLHTTIKLNPTLLGPVDLRSLLNGEIKSAAFTFFAFHPNSSAVQFNH